MQPQDRIELLKTLNFTLEALLAQFLKIGFAKNAMELFKTANSNGRFLCTLCGTDF
jgi:hypothetical protein